MFHALESIFDHSWEIGWLIPRVSESWRWHRRSNNLHREPYALSRLNMDAFCLYGYMCREKGDVSLGDQGRGHVTRVWQPVNISEDETGWQTANRMSWPLRFALSRLSIRSTLAQGLRVALMTARVVLSGNIRSCSLGSSILFVRNQIFLLLFAFFEESYLEIVKS